MLTVNTILHPTDFSEHSKYALEVASALARDLGARLEILHVVPSRTPIENGPRALPQPEELQEELKSYQEEMQSKLRQLKPPDPFVRVKHEMKEGNVATSILRVAEDVPCDLIVMGTHGRSEREKKLLGSVAEEVMRRAPCAVLTVKPPQAQAVAVEPEVGAACVG